MTLHDESVQNWIAELQIGVGAKRLIYSRRQFERQPTVHEVTAYVREHFHTIDVHVVIMKRGGLSHAWEVVTQKTLPKETP